MVMFLYSHTRIGTEQGLRQLFAYGSPCVTEKPTWPHGVSYQLGPVMFQRSSPLPSPRCARARPLKTERMRSRIDLALIRREHWVAGQYSRQATAHRSPPPFFRQMTGY